MSGLKLTETPIDQTTDETLEANPFRSSEMYSTNEVAHVLKVSRKTIERMVLDGRIPQPTRSKILSSKPRWPGARLRAWYQQHFEAAQ